MNPLFSRLFIVTALALTSSVATAQTSSHTAAATQALPQVDGEIRKVDAATGKITIRHGDIPNLGMTGMTMVFRAAPALVGQAKEGEKVTFTADRVDGALTVMSLRPVQSVH